MDLIKVMERFPDQESCITHLEKMRWKGKPKCPHCESTHVGRRTETEEGRIGRLELPRLPCYFQSHLRHSVSRHKDSVAEVVFGDLIDCECQEKFVKSSTGARFRLESKDSMVYPDAYTR